MPTYNEAENIPLIIPAIFHQSSKIHSHELHVLVVDDNSPDGTQTRVTEFQSTYKNLHLIIGEKKGLGEAYKRGMDYAINMLNPDLILEMDADLQHDPELIPLFITLSSYGFSLVIGSRFAPGGETPNFSFRRRMVSVLGNWLIRFLGGLPRIHDCTSGYRCIKVELIKKCDLSFLSTRGYSFQSSFLCELLRRGARVVEIPIIFPDRKFGRSKLAVRDQIEFLLNIPKIRFNSKQKFIRYTFIGAIGAVVNLSVYYVLTRVFGIFMESSSLIAVEVSILTNYFLYSCLFVKQSKPLFDFHRVIKFHLLFVPGGITNFLILLFSVYLFGIWDLLAHFVGLVLGTMINYFINSLLIWKSQGGAENEQVF